MIYFINALESFPVIPIIQPIIDEYLYNTTIKVGTNTVHLGTCCEYKLIPVKVVNNKDVTLFTSIRENEFRDDKHIEDNHYNIDGRTIFTDIEKSKLSALLKKISNKINTLYPKGFEDIVEIFKDDYGIRSVSEYQLHIEDKLQVFLSNIDNEKLYIVKTSIFPNTLKGICKDADIDISKIKILNLVRNMYIDALLIPNEYGTGLRPRPRKGEYISDRFIFNILNSLLYSTSDLPVYDIRYEDIILQKSFTLDREYSIDVDISNIGSYFSAYDNLDFRDIISNKWIENVDKIRGDIDKINELGNIFMDSLDGLFEAAARDKIDNRIIKSYQVDIIKPPIFYLIPEDDRDYMGISIDINSNYVSHLEDIKKMKNDSITFSSYFKYPKIDLRKIIYNT